LILSVNVELPEHDPGVMIDRGEQMMGGPLVGAGTAQALPSIATTRHRAPITPPPLGPLRSDCGSRS
jgi:hypothetical protein